MKAMSIIIFLIQLKLIFVYGKNASSSSNYDPEELLGKIFNLDDSAALKDIDTPFQEDVPLDQQPRQYGFYHTNLGSQVVLEQNAEDPNKRKRRRRRRKPKKQHLQGYPEEFPGQDVGYYGNDVPRPVRRPRPSTASGALSSIIGALTSIALYDDRQCVPRLLCEAAGGGNLGSSSILNTVSGLQPLLTLLSAYNGLSTSPLFVFGRAVFLGMTSKENPASCRYAYPTCPTDPEQLVYYLNNHNGGFFRFFNAPQPQGQNVQQLYQHLSGQYGLIPGQDGPVPGQYGLLPGREDLAHPQKFLSYQDYERDNSIEERIQNKPNKYTNQFENKDRDSFWKFPDEYNNQFYEEDDFVDETKIRETKSLKFPDDPERYSNYEPINKYSNTRKGKAVSFPVNEKYKNYNAYTKPDYKDYVFDNEHNIYVMKHDDNYQTVYVVRGNGDVNHPEIVRLRPGETLPK